MHPALPNPDVTLPTLLGPHTPNGVVLIDQAITQYQPGSVHVALSGGDDSLAVLHLAHYLPGLITGAVFIDTGINLPGAEERAGNLAADHGLSMTVYRALENTLADGTPDPQDYDQMVMAYGFPGPFMHRKMFNRLKGRAFARHTREQLARHGGRVMLLSGTRRSESQRRARVVEPHHRDGNTVWVAPMWDWSTRRRNEHLEHFRLPRNPFKPKVGVSGDCLCGAYAKPGELSRITRHFPCVGARLHALQDRVNAAGFPWGYEDAPITPAPAGDLFSEHDAAFNFTCVGCSHS